MTTSTVNSQSPLVEKKKKNERRAGITALLSDAGISFGINPSLSVIQELRPFFRGGPKKLTTLISIGTARKSSSHNILSLRSILKKAVDGFGDPESGHHRMEQMEAREFDYYRLNEPNGLEDVEMDDWKPRNSASPGSETIEAMKAAFKRWVAEPANQAAVREAATNLVRIRLARTNDYSRWERFALGRSFICPANDCFMSDEKWHYRRSFSQHLRSDHGYDEDQVSKAIRGSYRDWKYKTRDTYS